MTAPHFKPTRTTLLVEARLAEAGRSLRGLPSADARFLAGVRAQWPQVVQEDFDRWVGYNRHSTREVRMRPTSAQITRMDEVLFTWLVWLRQDEMPGRHVPRDLAAIVFARACRFSWRKIMRMRRRTGYSMGGNSHVSLRKLYRMGIAQIAARLEDENITLDVPDDWQG